MFPIAKRSLTHPMAAFLCIALGLSGCASAPRKGPDRQCGYFCERINVCLENHYGEELKEKLCDMSRCESGCRENIQSPAGYLGAFQFGSSTWKEVCGPIFKSKGLPQCQPTKARADLCCASECAAEMVSRGMNSRWPNCG